MANRVLPPWFVIVNPDSGIKTLQQGNTPVTVGAVGPYATKAQAAEWADLCWDCKGDRLVLFRQSGSHGINQRMGKCPTCKGLGGVSDG